MGVDADLLAGSFDGLHVRGDQVPDLLGVEGAEAVHQVEGVNGALGNDLQGLRQFMLRHHRDRHELHRRLVALLVGILYHIHSNGYLVDVGGDANDVQNALLFRQDVFVIVAALRVRHGAQLQGSGVIADDAANVLLVAVLPRAVLAGRVYGLGALVAHLHVINARGHACFVHGPHEVVVELVIVDQTSVPDSAVKQSDVGPVGQP
ncbi:hypothetical protein ES703_108972 [subsurface metagenome]